MRRVSRRDFLMLIGKGLVGAELLRFLPDLPEKIVYGQAPAFPLAAVSSGTNADTPEVILKTALDGLGGLQRFVQPGMTVAIKPNATWAYPPHTASSTDPDMLRTMIRMVRSAGAGRVVVIDHCSIDPGTTDCLRVSGIGKVVDEEGVEGIFPDRTNAPLSTYHSIELPDGKAFHKLGVIKAATEADLRINLAVAKTHNVTKLTLCMKHLMGFLQAPGLLHTDLDQGIPDLSAPSSPIHAQLHILEALRVRLPSNGYRVCAGPETDESNPDVVRRWNQIVAGTDPVLIDSYATITYFDMLPEELAYLQKAAEGGLGETDVQAALQDGRLRQFTAGQPVEAPAASPTPAPAESATPTQLEAGPVGLAGDATSTPLPTATPHAQTPALQSPGAETGTGSPSSQVLDPRPFLSYGLIPAAMLVAGAGLVAASRLARPDEDQDDHE